MSFKKRILSFIINRTNLFGAGLMLYMVSFILFILYMITNNKMLHQSDNIPFIIWLYLLGMIVGGIWSITGIVGEILKSILTYIHSKIN